MHMFIFLFYILYLYKCCCELVNTLVFLQLSEASMLNSKSKRCRRRLRAKKTNFCKCLE